MVLTWQSPVALAATNGTWARGIEAALPANAAKADPGVEVTSVSCPSVGNCVAVSGYFESSGYSGGLLLTETGGVWRRGVQAPAPTVNANLTSVSCVSAGNCTAVGYAGPRGNANQDALMLTETRGVWRRGVEARLPANAATHNPFVELNSVSCASAGNCTAVGFYFTNTRADEEGLLLTETGGVWARGVEAPLPTNAVKRQLVDLPSVSCASAGNCVSVGSYEPIAGAPAALLLTEKAGRWSRGVAAALPPDAAAPPNAASDMASTSCASAGHCIAVGSYRSGSGFRPLLLTETGSGWAPGFAPTMPTNASPAQNAGLESVSCASVGNCTAVGVYTCKRAGQQGLLLTEHGGTWSNGVRAALPASAKHAALGSVTCASAGNCAAAGVYKDNLGHDQGLLLTERASTWTSGVEAGLPANASGTHAIVDSLSCASTGSCSAVGTYTDRSERPQGLLLSRT